MKVGFDTVRTFNIWRTFLFHKKLFVAKEGSSDYKKVRKRWFFKEPLTDWFFVEPQMVPLWYDLNNLLSTFIFKSEVCMLIFCDKLISLLIISGM